MNSIFHLKSTYTCFINDFVILDVKFEVVDSLPMETRVWATHLPSELVPIERILKLGVKVC